MVRVDRIRTGWIESGLVDGIRVCGLDTAMVDRIRRVLSLLDPIFLPSTMAAWFHNV